MTKKVVKVRRKKRTVVKNEGDGMAHVYVDRPPHSEYKGRRCEYVLASGKTCGSFAKKGYRYCAMHIDMVNRERREYYEDASKELRVTGKVYDAIHMLMDSRDFRLESENDVIAYLLRIAREKYRIVGYHLDRFEVNARERWRVDAKEEVRLRK